ncbi:hypothetical protein CAPTEDRAFT_21251 [Capitella teleta]|uniref:Delta(3,5)-Delta(2,4)-dienoyl-CoA isomerase, mitochondrial n=1 Tax=Capitella teleta TaxID=283909 RepID=R7T637_CAPTE|nr:hypothetical protein CAPTEDRAFT_21251 [Capitella teleta]|eukprot:ELT88830.1 hypothetical protein CAPTEDRAFT_21251 [Capitella teleta]
MFRNLAKIGRSASFSQAPQNLKTSTVHLQPVRAMSALPNYKFETLKVTSPKEFVYEVTLNRPDALNSMNKEFWYEVPACFNQISTDTNCRAVVITGSGRLFTAGLDLSSIAEVVAFEEDEDVARRSMKIMPTIRDFQKTFTAIEKCNKPVIAAIHNACIGGGVDLITSCDIRYCTKDAFFQIKEVDIGLAADVGTLQRLPKIVGNDSLVRELVYTARRFQSDEALSFGLVSRVFPNRDACVSGAIEMAELIASKSPVAVTGSKVNMVYSRDHGVQEGLDFIAVWNQGMLQSEDVMKAAMASMQKETPKFSKL